MKDLSAMNFHNKIDDIVEGLLKLDIDPFEIHSMIKYSLDSKIENLIRKEYIKIQFDSPQGKDSVATIARNFPELSKSNVKWNGLDGNRGTTTIFIRDKNLDVSSFVKKLRKNEVLDNMSDVIIEM